MRGDRAVVDDDLGVAHQAVAILDVSGEAGQGVDHPEFREGEIEALARPVRGQSLQIERKRTALEDLFGGLRCREQIAPSEKRRDPGEQMRQAHVLGQVIVCAQPQARNDIEIGIARGEKDDGHRRRHRAELAAQREAAVDVVAQPDVDDREVREPGAECRERVGAIGVRRDLIALLAQHIDVIPADRWLVLDDSDAAAHIGDGGELLERRPTITHLERARDPVPGDATTVALFSP